MEKAIYEQTHLEYVYYNEDDHNITHQDIIDARARVEELQNE